jgi:hypothetical protein
MRPPSTALRYAVEQVPEMHVPSRSGDRTSAARGTRSRTWPAVSTTGSTGSVTPLKIR